MNEYTDEYRERARNLAALGTIQTLYAQDVNALCARVENLCEVLEAREKGISDHDYWADARVRRVTEENARLNDRLIEVWKVLTEEQKERLDNQERLDNLGDREADARVGEEDASRC